MGGEPFIHEPGSTLTLAPGQRSFEVEFAALDLSSPDRNGYAYRLKGFDDHWTRANATRRVAAFTAVPPGSYLLEVRGSNRAGIWSGSTLQIPVIVLPAIHQTLAFRLLLALVALVALYVAYRLRIRVLESRRIELEKLVQSRTADLDRAARTDFLTELSNRRNILERATAIEATGEPYGVILGDIDNFKRLNDELGHDAGDSALRHVADILRENVRKSDIPARWGGEEFLILLPETDASTATAAAERIRQALNSSAWIWEGRSRFVTMTLGVTVSKTSEALDTVIRRADEALLEAKRDGKNRVRLASLATA